MRFTRLGGKKPVTRIYCGGNVEVAEKKQPTSNIRKSDSDKKKKSDK